MHQRRQADEESEQEKENVVPSSLRTHLPHPNTNHRYMSKLQLIAKNGDTQRRCRNALKLKDYYKRKVEDYKNVRGRDHENLIRRVMTDLHIKEGGSFRQNLLNTAAAIKSKEPSNSAMIIDED